MTSPEPVPPGGIGPIRPVQVPASEPVSSPAREEFRRILAELEQLSKAPAGQEAAFSGADEQLDPPALLRRLEQAGESFQKLMEIRSRLEQAWAKSRNPYGKESPG